MHSRQYAYSRVADAVVCHTESTSAAVTLSINMTYCEPLTESDDRVALQCSTEVGRNTLWDLCTHAPMTSHREIAVAVTLPAIAP